MQPCFSICGKCGDHYLSVSKCPCLNSERPYFFTCVKCNSLYLCCSECPCKTPNPKHHHILWKCISNISFLQKKINGNKSNIYPFSFMNEIFRGVINCGVVEDSCDYVAGYGSDITVKRFDLERMNGNILFHKEIIPGYRFSRISKLDLGFGKKGGPNHYRIESMMIVYELLILCKGYLFLCGGAVVSIIMGDDIDDYDLFFVCGSVEEANTQLRLCLEKLDSFGIDDIFYKSNPNVITVTTNNIIIKFFMTIYPSINQILDGFDIAPCKCGLGYVRGSFDFFGNIEAGLSMLTLSFPINYDQITKLYTPRIVSYNCRGFNILIPEVSYLVNEINSIDIKFKREKYQKYWDIESVNNDLCECNSDECEIDKPTQIHSFNFNECEWEIKNPNNKFFRNIPSLKHTPKEFYGEGYIPSYVGISNDIYVVVIQWLRLYNIPRDIFSHVFKEVGLNHIRYCFQYLHC